MLRWGSYTGKGSGTIWEALRAFLKGTTKGLLNFVAGHGIQSNSVALK